MKQTKKLLALMLALVMAFSLMACGGGNGGSKDDGADVAGTYYGTELSLFSDDDWTGMTEYYGNSKEENYLQLNADGTGSGTVNDMPIEFKWTLKGSDLNLEAILSDFDKDLYKQLEMEPTTTGKLENGTITLDYYLGTQIGMRFVREGGVENPENGSSAEKGEFPLSFASVYEGDWVGLTKFYDCTGDFESNNGQTCHALARFLFDDNGNCTPFIIISVDQNGGLSDVSVTYDAADDDMDLHGKLIGYDLTDESFVQFYTDEDLLYINLAVEKDNGSALKIVCCLRPIGQSWSDDDYLRLQPEFEEMYNGMTLEEIVSYWGLSVTIPTEAASSDNGTTNKPSTLPTGGTKVDTSSFDGELVIGDKKNAAINYPTDKLQESLGALQQVSGDYMYFESGMYVYPEGSSSIEGSHNNMSNNLKKEKEFHEDLTYTVGGFPCHHVRYIDFWDNVVHCYLLDTTSLGSSDVAAVYFKVEMASEADQLPLAEAIIGSLHLK